MGVDARKPSGLRQLLECVRRQFVQLLLGDAMQPGHREGRALLRLCLHGERLEQPQRGERLRHFVGSREIRFVFEEQLSALGP
ncbi:hypothetical protein D3C83_89280 [compost metagenome]